MSLLYRFPLNKNLKNIGVCGGNLSVNGSATLSTDIGKFGSSYYFPSNSYLYLSSPDLSKFSTEISMSVLVMFSQATSSWKQTLLFGSSGTSWNNILCGIDINTSGIPYFNASSGSASNYIAGTTNVYDGKWHNIIGIYDNGKKSIYVDGVRENYQTSASTLINLSSVTNLFVGGNSGGEKF